MIAKLRSVEVARLCLKLNGLRTLRAGVVAVSVFYICANAHAAPPRPAFHSPGEAVVALYRLASIPITSADKQRFFSWDMMAALIRDSERDDEVGIATDGDYRYDAQDMKITALRINATAIRNGAGTVRVAFSNFGKAQAVTYDLCSRGPHDWRISDVITPSGGSLRKLLGLAQVAQMKGC